MNVISFIRERARFYNCPACARNLENCDVKMLRQDDSYLMIEVTCARCHVSFNLALAFQRAGATEPELPEEPTVADGSPISNDEVLELHDLLRGFQGNLTDLIKSHGGDVTDR
jgi:hypothetical protein